MISLSLLLALGACQEDVLLDEQRLPSANPGARHGPDDLADPNGAPRYPYLDITKQEFIPPYGPFSHVKTLAWRISWPVYDASVDVGEIPTMFTLPVGALYSFNYLNSIDKENTYQTHFSLYYQDRVETAYTLWDELNIPLGEGSSMVTSCS